LLNGLEKKMKKIVLVIKHVSFFPAVFVPGDFALINVGYLHAN
jgi:hypothetical protein